ncbi:antiviral reverse transcriptase Drt2 [Aeromonas salmonicida]|uniref:antiviral reverse transcriptase Drt2 n=1 Tax=Aeromonas salmonicida TaxID=645 RepID=UPI00370D6C75
MMNSENKWFRSRGYLHFDSPVKLRKACQIVKSPLNVAQHAFFPLIKYDIQSLKISIDKDGNVLKKIKTRPISYASHIDSHIYSYYAGLLSDLYEKALDKSQLQNSVLAFRTLGKSNIDFANIAFEKIKAHGYCTAIAMDISGFFDNLDHDILKSMWCKLLQKNSLPNDHFNIYRSLTKSSVVNRDLLYTALKISKNNPKAAGLRLCDIKTFREKVRGLELIKTNSTGRGIPQGTSISALLSNIYMLDFDKKIKDIVKSISGEYYRYCDDMLFIIDSDKTSELMSLVTQSISELKIEINDKKTEIRTFHTYRGVQKCDKPLQYLGFIYDGERKLIRSAALAREGANKRGNSSRLTQSFHFFMFEPFFLP